MFKVVKRILELITRARGAEIPFKAFVEVSEWLMMSHSDDFLAGERRRCSGASLPEVLPGLRWCEVDLSSAPSKRRWEEGKSLGPLDGVPFAVKDNLNAVNYKTSYGTWCLDLDADLSV